MLTSRAKHSYTIAALSLMLSTVPTYTLDKETTTTVKSVAKIAGGSVLILSALYLAYKAGFKYTGENLLSTFNLFSDKELNDRVSFFNALILPVMAGGCLTAHGVKDLLKK